MWKVSAARSGNRLVRLTGVLGCVVALVSFAAGPSLAARQPPEPKNVPRPVKKLWSEYPLNPGPPAEDPRSQTPSRPVVENSRPLSPSTGDDSEGVSPWLLLSVAVGMVGVFAVLLALRHARVPAAEALSDVPRDRAALRRLVFRGRPAHSGIPIPRRPEGGRLMSYFRRLRGTGSDDEKGPAVAGDELSVDRFLPYAVRAGAETARSESDRSPEERQDDPGEEDAGPGGASLEGARRSDPAVYDQLGEHVSTVLSSADEAANRLQQSAAEQAERIRAEAETYAQETRAAADVYAEGRRESAETEASAIVSDAENQAREVREAAELEAADIQRDAVRRRESLLEESERAEERLRNLLQVFRAMTERLEGLVGGDAAQAPLASEAADKDLAETLVAHSRSSAPATEKRRAAES